MITMETTKTFLARLFMIAAMLIGVGVARAATQFPIPELGNCKNAQECKAFCDKDQNIQSCVAYAQAHGLMSQEQAQKAMAFAKAGSGPGGCNSMDTCEAYCESTDHLQECIAWADQHDMLPKNQIEEARKIADALKSGATLPGGCTNKDSCEAYCEESAHMQECLAFADKANLIPQDELDQAHKVLEALQSGAKLPGGCRNKDACEAYCKAPEHITACVDFAQQAGFISKEDADMARTMAPLIMEGKTPGKCTDKDSCEAYCSIPDHQEECMNFSQEAGVLPDQAKQAISEGIAKLKQVLDSAPAGVASCIKQEIGEGTLEKILSGEKLPSPEIEKTIQTCFAKNMMQGAGQGNGFPGMPSETPHMEPTEKPQGIETPHPEDTKLPQGIGGPGGCTSADSCAKYCADPSHLAECMNYRPQ